MFITNSSNITILIIITPPIIPSIEKLGFIVYPNILTVFVDEYWMMITIPNTVLINDSIPFKSPEKLLLFINICSNAVIGKEFFMIDFHL